MSQTKEQILAVLVVQNKKTAEALLKKLRRIDEYDKNGEIVDAAIAVRTKFNRIKVKQTKDVGAVKGGVGGGAIGVLVGGILLGPVGAVVGGVSGGTLSGLYTKLRDTGVDDKFMRKTAKELEKGKSALFIKYKGNWSASRGAIDDAVKATNAELIYTTLKAEQAEAVDEAVETATEELGGEEAAADYEVNMSAEGAAAEAPAGGDDLTKIKGVGPKSAELLGAAGIATYAKLASTSEPDLRQVFTNANSAVPKNVNTWAMQAAFAQNGDWPGLSQYNKHLKAEAEAGAPPPPAEPDDLTQLDGIGPKVAKALNAAGINTFEKLANTNEPQLRKAMHASDIPAPASLPTWPMQAAFAAQNDFQGLFKYNQKRSQGQAAKGKAKSTPEKAAKPDDLTQLRGIGPRISAILGAHGITTFADLQDTKPTELSEIISASGALPPSSLSTWPTQASYAAKGDWEGLAAYNKKKS